MTDFNLWQIPGLALQFLGACFLVANTHLICQFARFCRIRRMAQLTWPGRRPSYYGLFLGLGVVFGILVFVKLILQGRPLVDAFGEGMMLLYYAYLWPMSFRIRRGLYKGGIWTDTVFVRNEAIGGLSWREAKDITLVVIYRLRTSARSLKVPHAHYAEVRRLLRDRIASHQIHFTMKAFDLGSDEREVV